MLIILLGGVASAIGIFAAVIGGTVMLSRRPNLVLDFLANSATRELFCSLYNRPLSGRLSGKLNQIDKGRKPATGVTATLIVLDSTRKMIGSSVALASSSLQIPYVRDISIPARKPPIGIPIVAPFDNHMTVLVADDSHPFLRPGRYHVTISLLTDQGTQTHLMDMEISWKPWRVAWRVQEFKKGNPLKRLLRKVTSWMR